MPASVAHARHPHIAVVIAVASLTVLAACTGAKKPISAVKGGPGAGRAGVPGQIDPATGQTVPSGPAGAPGATAAPGASGGSGGSGRGGVSGGSPTANSNGRGASGGGNPTGPGGRALPGQPGSSGGTVGVTATGDPDLFAGASNTRGITNDQIVLCAHAALTYGPAFNASAADFNVHYQAVNDGGGIYGRKITATYENDNYDPATAVQAADACKAKGPFAILGGIGFDQIPAVRNWAETNKELYLYHIATEVGAAGKQYSFTTQPSVEQVGREFGELVASRYPGHKVGILYRDSEFWAPGFEAFKAVGKAHGINIVAAYPVQQNQANYTQELINLRNAGADVVWGWENTLALTQMVKQAKAQAYSPHWVAFPFNLTAQTLGKDALTPTMIGLASWPGYSKGDYGGTFAPYASDMKQFEAEYAKYRPNTDLSGVAGDLLWLNWVEQKQLIDVLTACGKGCTRDHFAGLLDHGYKATTTPGCPLDFSAGHNGSGGLVDVLETYQSPSGKVNWRSIARCKSHLL